MSCSSPTETNQRVGGFVWDVSAIISARYTLGDNDRQPAGFVTQESETRTDYR